jgi:hypothetical protein
MKSFLQIAVFLFASLSLAHGQSLPPCAIPRAITQSCSIAPGTYTVASTITISQSDILIKCLPGATLVQGSNTSIFRVTGNNVTIDGCIFDANNLSIPEVNGALVAYDTNGFVLRNCTVKNVIGDSNAGVWLKKTTNSLIEKNTLLGPSGGVLAVGSEDALQIINNRVTGQIWIQSQADSDSGPSASIVVSGNIITPTLNGTGGCGLVQDASNSTTKPIQDFTFSNNICRIQGTDASHHVFGAFSLVSNNSGTCTVANNVVEAYGQYIDYALWEIGLTGCTFSGNMTHAGGDTNNQSYQGWVIYSGNNTFTGNNTVGWGANGSGMSFYPQNLSAPYANNNVVTGGSLIASSTGAAGNIGLNITCNVSGSSIRNLKVSGLLISGAFNRGINSEGDWGPNCPVSVTLDSVTISGATKGIQTYTTTIGVQNVYTIENSIRWVQLPNTVVITP